METMNGGAIFNKIFGSLFNVSVLIIEAYQASILSTNIAAALH